MRGPSNSIPTTSNRSNVIRYDDVQLTIKDRWVLQNRLGRGTYGVVQKGYDKHTNTNVAVKIESYLCENEEMRNSKLRKEYEVLKALCADIPNGETIGFTTPIYFASSDFLRVMVMDLLGSSVMKSFNCRCVSLPEVYSVGIQVLNRLEHMHNCGYLHLDVKMDNIIFGKGEDNTYVYLADFGLSERYLEVNGNHRLNVYRHRSTGTNNFNSLNMSDGQTPSRRDDIETLGHVLVCLYFKALPWISPSAWHMRHVGRQTQGTILLETGSPKVVYEEFPPSVNQDSFGYNSKEIYPLKKLCEGMPGLEEFIRYARELDYGAKPDYKFLRSLLRRKVGHASFKLPLREMV